EHRPVRHANDLVCYNAIGRTHDDDIDHLAVGNGSDLVGRLPLRNHGSDTNARRILWQQLRHMGSRITVQQFLKLVNVKQRRPVRMLLEVIADDVLDDHLAAIKIRQPNRVTKSLVRIWRKIGWEQNFFEGYHCLSLLEPVLNSQASFARAVPSGGTSLKPSIDGGFDEFDGRLAEFVIAELSKNARAIDVVFVFASTEAALEHLLTRSS